jgi:hypothetical protein
MASVPRAVTSTLLSPPSMTSETRSILLVLGRKYGVDTLSLDACKFKMFVGVNDDSHLDKK